MKTCSALLNPQGDFSLQVGFQASAWVSLGAQIGDEVMVKVEEAHPRDDVIFLKEVVKG